MSRELVRLDDSVKKYRMSAISKNTIRAYSSKWKAFEAWCILSGTDTSCLSSSDVCRYLASLADAGYRISTIEAHRAALAEWSRRQGCDGLMMSIDIQQTVKGIRNRDHRPVEKHAPLLTPHIVAMLDDCGTNLAGVRDAAIIATGYGIAGRISETLALTIADIERKPDGCLVTIRRSKTDQQGHGVVAGLPRGDAIDPAGRLVAWIETLAMQGIIEGPIFRKISRHGRVGSMPLDQSTARRMIKRRAASAGLDVGRISTHSLRSGLATQAAEDGIGLDRIMTATRHKSVAVALGYIRRADILRDHPLSNAS